MKYFSTSLRLAAGAKVAGATVADTLDDCYWHYKYSWCSITSWWYSYGSCDFQAITLATQGGNKELNTFASVTGMTAESFKQLATDDPARALNVFLIAYKKDAGDSGRNVIEIFRGIGS